MVTIFALYFFLSFVLRTVKSHPSPNSPVKPQPRLANNIPRISIMTHQLLFAKNITQIAQRIKLL